MVNLIKETLGVGMYSFPFIYFQNSYVHQCTLQNVIEFENKYLKPYWCYWNV